MDLPSALSMKNVLYTVALLVATVLELSRGKMMRCPNNIRQSINRCMQPYTVHMNQVNRSYTNLYSGVDVEQIRLICEDLRSGLRCAHSIKQHCPDNQYADIELELRNVYNMVTLCNYENLYEEYALHQSCFYELSANTETCYNKFRSATEGVATPASMGDTRSLSSYCRSFRGLVACMQRHVAIKCAEGANLIEYLVRPAIVLSDQCTQDTHTGLHPSTALPSSHYDRTRTRQSQPVNQQQQNVNSAGLATVYPHATTITLLAAIVTTLINLHKS